MNTPVIYKIRNVTNQKFYVGSTTNKRERFRNHRKQLRGGRHHCPHLQAAWDKYGEECFVFEVVEEVATVADLFAAENRWLDAHFGQPYCYNAGRSAEAPMRGRAGHLHPSYQREWSQEVRDAISASVKRKYAEDPDYAPRRGKTHTDETKAAISRARVGKHSGANHYRYGKQVSPEVRAKIGDAQRGKPKAPGRKVSAEGLAKIRANIEAGRSHKHWVGRTHTAETRAKLSAPVVARAPDGTETRYASITELRSALGLKPPTVNRALKSGVPLTKGPRAGWSFRYVSSTPAKPRKKQQDLAYMHQKEVKAAVVAVYTDAPESGTSEWPTELRYSGFRWGRHEVHTDVFWLPEDLEVAIVQLILDIKGDLTVYWEQVSRSFPARVVAELRKIAAQLSGTAGRQLPEVP